MIKEQQCGSFNNSDCIINLLFKKDVNNVKQTAVILRVLELLGECISFEVAL